MVRSCRVGAGESMVSLIQWLLSMFYYVCNASIPKGFVPRRIANSISTLFHGRRQRNCFPCTYAAYILAFQAFGSSPRLVCFLCSDLFSPRPTFHNNSLPRQRNTTEQRNTRDRSKFFSLRFRVVLYFLVPVNQYYFQC